MQFHTQTTKNQKGQGILEYIILTALIGIFCLAAVKKIGSALETRLENMSDKIQEIEV